MSVSLRENRHSIPGLRQAIGSRPSARPEQLREMAAASAGNDVAIELDNTLSPDTKRKKSNKNIILVGGSKGGIGKSMFAATFGDWVRNDLGIKLACFDGDGEVGGLIHVLGTRDERLCLLPEQDPLAGCGWFDIRSYDPLERGVVLTCTNTGHDTLVDLAGGAKNELKRIVDQGTGVEFLVDQYQSRGYAVSLVHLVDRTEMSTLSVGSWMETFGDTVRHVVVRNMYSASRFEFWEGYYDDESNRMVGGTIRRRLLDAGGIIVDLPALDEHAATRLEAKKLTVSKAVLNPRLDQIAQGSLKWFKSAFVKNMQPLKQALGY